MMLFSRIWKLFSTYLLWKLSVIALDSLGPIYKESIVCDRRFSCSYLIINLHVKLVKLLMLLIILLILRRNLLFINKLLLLFRRNHVPILLTDYLVTLNPLMLLRSTSLSQFTEVSNLLWMSGCAMKTFSNKSIHRRGPLWITRVPLLIFNNWSGPSI